MAIRPLRHSLLVAARPLPQPVLVAARLLPQPLPVAGRGAGRQKRLPSPLLVGERKGLGVREGSAHETSPNAPTGPRPPPPPAAPQVRALPAIVAYHALRFASRESRAVRHALQIAE